MGSKYATHCKNGHELTPENTLIQRYSSGKTQRRCRKCKRWWDKLFRVYGGRRTVLTDKMRQAFGYDDAGNAPSLLADRDRREIERGVPRASGMVVCVCGVQYNRHPPVQGALWATRTCTGIVKL